MYLGIDIGGSKVLIAKLNNAGVIVSKTKFKTPEKYQDFLNLIEESDYKNEDYLAAGIGAPGEINRFDGSVREFGNLSWKNVKLSEDIEKIFNCPVVIENDAKMAALSEAMMVKNLFKRVLYLTVSTGIGYAFINECQIDTLSGDAGGKNLLIPKGDDYITWEDYISGRAIVKRFGKMAKDIEDQQTWKKIAKDLSKGLIELIAIFEPEVVIFGGSVGNYFERYKEFLEEAVKAYQIPMVKLPVLKKAERPEDAVIYGCYDLAKATFKAI